MQTHLQLPKIGLNVAVAFDDVVLILCSFDVATECITLLFRADMVDLSLDSAESVISKPIYPRDGLKLT
jgi:hypothetical protein